MEKEELGRRLDVLFSIKNELPKEKAEELYYKMYYVIFGMWLQSGGINTGKQSASA